MELNKIYNMDCLEGFKIIPDNSIDLIVTDPPYNTSQSKSFKNTDGTVGWKGWKPILETEWDAMPTEVFREWLSLVLTECHRVLKKNGSMYINMGMGQLHFVGMELERLGFYTLNMIAWYQPNKFPNNYGKTRYNPATEIMYFVRKGKSHYFKYTEFLRDMWEFKTVQGNERIHPAQKPLELYERCIIHSCPDVYGIVLDPFMGSGTTAVASIKNNKNFIGFELNKENYEKCNKRIENTITNLN